MLEGLVLEGFLVCHIFWDCHSILDKGNTVIFLVLFTVRVSVYSHVCEGVPAEG